MIILLLTENSANKTKCYLATNKPTTECFQLEFAVLIQQAHVGRRSDLLRLLRTGFSVAASAVVVETVPRVTRRLSICCQFLHSSQLRLQLFARQQFIMQQNDMPPCTYDTYQMLPPIKRI